MGIPITLIDLLPSSAVAAGEVFCGSLDCPLSAEGLKMLKKTVRRRNDWQAVISSPHPACLPFAEWLVQKNRVPLRTYPAFAEMGFGQWEGQLPLDIMSEDAKVLARWWRNPASLTPPGGEPFLDFQGRVLEGWERLLKEHKGKTVLVVAHPGVVRVLVSSVLGMPSQNFFSLHVEAASLTRIRVMHDEAGAWSSVMMHGCQPG